MTKRQGIESMRSAPRHGHAKRGAKTAEYRTWCSMKKRCNTPSESHFDRYGGRGISFCSRWEKFENFLEDMGPRPSPRHSLDRINNDGNYEPSNCRWASLLEQRRNTSANRRLTFGGKTMTAVEWADETGIPRGTLWGRLRRGWATERALTQPVRHAGTV